MPEHGPDHVGGWPLVDDGRRRVMLHGRGRPREMARGETQDAVRVVRDGVVLDLVDHEGRLSEDDETDQRENGAAMPRGARPRGE